MMDSDGDKETREIWRESQREIAVTNESKRRRKSEIEISLVSRRVFSDSGP